MNIRLCVAKTSGSSSFRLLGLFPAVTATGKLILKLI